MPITLLLPCQQRASPWLPQASSPAAPSPLSAGALPMEMRGSELHPVLGVHAWTHGSAVTDTGPSRSPTPLPSKDSGSQSPALGQAAAPAAQTLDLRLQLSPSLRSPDASVVTRPLPSPPCSCVSLAPSLPPDHRPLQPVARGSWAHLRLCLRQLRSLPLAPAAPALHAARGQPASPSLGRSPWCQNPSPQAWHLVPVHSLH